MSETHCIYNIEGKVIYKGEGCTSLREALEKAVREKVNLYRANLEKANLSFVDLTGAKLQGADLRKANLYRANLQGANFSGAYLCFANLQGANLQGANLEGANLREAIFTNANVSDTVLDPSRPCPDATEALRAAGFSIDDQGFVLAYDPVVYFASPDCEREVGQRYKATHFSIDTTSACHPGLYFATKQCLTEKYPGQPWVKVRTHVDSVVAAGDKFRARWLEVIELVREETPNE